MTNLAFVDLAGLHGLASKEARGWLLHGIFPAGGVTLLAGDPMVGKTRFLAQLAVAVSTGLPLCQRDTKKGPVLWVEAEHTLGELAVYIEASVLGLEAGRRKLRIQWLGQQRHTWRLDNAEDVEALRKIADEIDARLIIIDSFRRVTTLEETRSEDVSTVMRFATDLTSSNRRAVIVTHHLAKAGNPRGSTDFSASVQSVVTLTKSSGGRLRLVARHHGAPEDRWVLTINHARDKKGKPLMTVTTDESAGGDDDSQRERTRAVREAILTSLERGEELNVSELRAAVRVLRRCEHQAVDEQVAQLVKDGLVTERRGPKKARLFRITSPATTAKSNGQGNPHPDHAAAT